MKKALLVSPLLLALLACSDDGGGGPTEPTPTPNPNVNINGSWAGTASALTARGTCLADSFLPFTVAVNWTIRQTGASFTATELLNGAQLCAFTGTVQGDRVTFRPDLPRSQATCGVQNLACSGLRPVRIELNTSRTEMTGVVGGNRMTLTSTAVWQVFDSNTGNSLGDYEISGRQDLTR